MTFGSSDATAESTRIDFSCGSTAHGSSADAALIPAVATSRPPERRHASVCARKERASPQIPPDMTLSSGALFQTPNVLWITGVLGVVARQLAGGACQASHSVRGACARPI